MILNLLNLIGILPHHLEITANPCQQGCEYCYAKIWKREYSSVDKILNDIINQRNKKEGLLSFYLNNFEPIALSNRSDILCHAEWFNLLKTIKKLGYPLYIETKGNKEMLSLTEILDKKDEIYITITSEKNQKYEEKNLLKNIEKIEMAKILREKGISVVIGINPYMREKTNIDEILKIADYVKPTGMVIRPYHAPTRNKVGNINVKDLYKMKEDKTNQTKIDILKISDILLEMKIPIDSTYMQENLKYFKNKNLVLKYKDNKKMFNGKSLLCDEELIIMAKKLNQYKGYDIIEFYWEDFTEDFAATIEYHKDAIVKKSDISSRALAKINIPEKMTYLEALKILWNNYNLFQKSHGYYKDVKDKEGNLIYFYQLKEG